MSGWIEGRLAATAADRSPRLFVEDPRSEFGFPEDLELLALMVVVEAGKRDDGARRRCRDGLD